MIRSLWGSHYMFILESQSLMTQVFDGIRKSQTCLYFWNVLVSFLDFILWK